MDTKSEKFKTLRQRVRRQLERDKSLIQQLRAIRDQQGLTQDEIAFRMGITQPAVSAIEKGNSDPNLGTIRRMALALGCQIFYIVTPVQDQYGDSMNLHSHSAESVAGSRQTFSVDYQNTSDLLAGFGGYTPDATTKANRGLELLKR